MTSEPYVPALYIGLHHACCSQISRHSQCRRKTMCATVWAIIVGSFRIRRLQAVFSVGRSLAGRNFLLLACGSAGRQVHDCHVNKREWVVSTPSASRLLTPGYALPTCVALGSPDVVKPNYYSMPEQRRSCSSVCPSETAKSSACYIPFTPKIC